MQKENINIRNEIKPESIILIGNPNVGKSVIFNLLTRSYATVSNYPGTTVEISQGRTKISGINFRVIDTPGISDFFGRTDDQKVTRDILLENPDAIFVTVIDAKSLKRGLVLSLFLCELGVKQVIVLNMMDEANDRGIFINHKKLSEIIGLPVVPMIATERVGLNHLKESIIKASSGNSLVSYTDDVEKFIHILEEKLPEKGFRKRGLAIFLAGATDQLYDICRKISLPDLKKIETIWEDFQHSISQPLYYLINISQMRTAENITKTVATKSRTPAGSLESVLNRLTIHPISGIFIVFIVLFFMYLIVGKFGAGFLVDITKEKIFGGIINPFFIKIFSHAPELVRNFFVGDYGIITMALSYGIGIVLPITGMFFLFFGFLEDCGYLPRLAFLTDVVFKSIGLTGKAVLPIVLGLGCGTMATLTTRILDTRKEKIIATVILAVAIPCSAQLGVVLGILGSISRLALLIWLATLFIVMIIVGSALNLLILGESSFLLEISPLRFPSIKNISIKTGRRIVWYLKEALPFFIIGTIILFILDTTGILTRFISFMTPVVSAMGLPFEMSRIFIMGFLRRDYGAAGMFDLFNKGILNPGQSVVSAVTLTLFVPCIAQFFVMIKERGLSSAILIFIFAIVIAFTAGFLLNGFITITGLF